CEHFGCEQTTLANAVKIYEGVARRFSLIKTRQNIQVVDDFAHNPAKIAAVVRTAQGLSNRIITVYQPHGFGPTRFLKDEYIATFLTVFRSNDSLYLLPIYYAGGTVQKDISSEDIIHGLGAASFHAHSVKNREELLARLQAEVKPEDCVLIMGARDPSLPAFVKNVIELFGGAI
ncbi:MAG TPA: cyanophycin synthetase, partial [Nitrospirota bacterium]|nr:cyanophycin synthetase [Nitrospirota bacterium]